MGDRGAAGECWGIDSGFARVGLEHPLSIWVGLSSEGAGVQWEVRAGSMNAKSSSIGGNQGYCEE